MLLEDVKVNCRFNDIQKIVDLRKKLVYRIIPVLMFISSIIFASGMSVMNPTIWITALALLLSFVFLGILFLAFIKKTQK
jgi:hypothetical protein